MRRAEEVYNELWKAYWRHEITIDDLLLKLSNLKYWVFRGEERKEAA